MQAGAQNCKIGQISIVNGRRRICYNLLVSVEETNSDILSPLRKMARHNYAEGIAMWSKDKSIRTHGGVVCLLPPAC